MTEFGFDLLQLARVGYILLAVSYGLFAIYLLVAWRGGRPGGILLLAMLAGLAWGILSAAALAFGGTILVLSAALADVLRGAAWLLFILVLIGRGALPWPLSGLAITSIVIVALQLLAVGLAAFGSTIAGDPIRLQTMTSLLAAVFGLVMIEQFYRGLPSDSRWAFKPLMLGLVAIFAFDLYLFAEGSLFLRLDPATWSVRGLAHVLILPLIGISVARNPSWNMRISVSRDVVFHSSALLISGVYLLLVAGAGYYVRFFGAEWGRAFQVALLFAGLLSLAAVLFSASLRARLRVWLNKHLFPYRYDYRTQWLGFTAALAAAGSSLSPGESVIKALGDLVESPGGWLWLREPGDAFHLQARLNAPETDAVEPADGPLAGFLERSGWIVNMEEFRARRTLYDDLTAPGWLSHLSDAWLVVPLSSLGTLIGFVILHPPRVTVDVNWEVLDLLKTAQQQAASYLGQVRASEALLEARKFEAFNKMSAFVVHDLKNLVAQMSLLLKNAERHRDNPEFQQDMLDTVAHVERRMRTLMAQLIEKTSIDQKRPVDIGEIMQRIVHDKRASRPHPQLTVMQSTSVMAYAERLERILGHIVQNALDATDEDGIVTVKVSVSERGDAEVEVSDSGVGMSEEFIREELFKPFRSTKKSGMGIGAFEARQCIRELGGTIAVRSEQGRGSSVTVVLPGCDKASAPVAANN